ncbi:3-oxoacid CoA-transferase subunit B [Niveispirillum sp.]|uniref:3-oxoacid CoA-transferase subunit B n=1 Tax=Niveispirillum sp. TaxID=1917217 RepID=UPI001B6AD88D|nr:3-oxoacid CoA-transferase subunit B [Niveispirillum sp.]MBP7336543.1 3-oxoacid CoA-transferase subunit B [Niveispirillum sp.]
MAELLPFSRTDLARRVAHDIGDGWYVNLGIGIPLLVSDFIPEGRQVMFHSENGLIGMGPRPEPDKVDPWLVNAGKQNVTIRPGGSLIHHADSFALIRGGHLDLCVLGAYQVSGTGDLANWATNDLSVPPGVGGAMDLAAGAKRVWVITDHTTKSGEPKLVEKCTYPLTAVGAVTRVYSSLAIIDVDRTGMTVREMAPGVTFDELQAQTGVPLRRGPVAS